MNKYDQNKKLVEFMRQIQKATMDYAPWSVDEPALSFGGRCYVESYRGNWSSYAASARSQQTSVSAYQWRAAGEWFAENYAFSWRNEKAPPNSHFAIDAYMWKPK